MRWSTKAFVSFSRNWEGNLRKTFHILRENMRGKVSLFLLSIRSWSPLKAFKLKVMKQTQNHKITHYKLESDSKVRTIILCWRRSSKKKQQLKKNFRSCWQEFDFSLTLLISRFLSLLKYPIKFMPNLSWPFFLSLTNSKYIFQWSKWMSWGQMLLFLIASKMSSWSLKNFYFLIN